MAGKDKDQTVTVYGIPSNVPERVAALARSRLHRVYSDVTAHTDDPDSVIAVGRAQALRGLGVVRRQQPGEQSRDRHERRDDEDVSTEERAKRYQAQGPLFTFSQLILPAGVSDRLVTAVEAIRLRGTIYDRWGLRAIEPTPSVALNLHGPPGTGKTLAAHAIAARLGMPIILAGYAELESKFHGDGPKNVKAAFHAAAQQRALLFVDEADSLLSRRLTNVTQGSEQAINSMRSQIVLCLDQFEGVVVFSTNLVTNYDRAFESRVRHFHFPLPDAVARLAIWRTMLVPELPLSEDVEVEQLAEVTEGFSGRDIKLVVIAAAERAALAGRDPLERADFVIAVDQAKAARRQLAEQRRQGEPTASERAAIEQHLDEHPPEPDTSRT